MLCSAGKHVVSPLREVKNSMFRPVMNPSKVRGFFFGANLTAWPKALILVLSVRDRIARS